MFRDKCVEELYLERFSKQFKKAQMEQQDIRAQQEQMMMQQVQSDANKKKIASDLVASMFAMSTQLEQQLLMPEIKAVTNGLEWYSYGIAMVNQLQTMATNLQTIIENYDSSGNREALNRVYHQDNAVTTDGLLPGIQNQV